MVTVSPTQIYARTLKIADVAETLAKKALVYIAVL